MPTVQIATNALSEGPAFVEMASTARIGQDICLSASPANGEGPPRGGVRCERFNGRSRRKAPLADRGLGPLNWAESGPPGVLSGRTGILAKADDPPGPSLTREETQRHEGRYLTPYERGKLKAHEVALKWREQGLALVIAVPNGVAGPNDHSTLGYFLRLTILAGWPRWLSAETRSTYWSTPMRLPKASASLTSGRKSVRITCSPPTQRRNRACRGVAMMKIGGALRTNRRTSGSRPPRCRPSREHRRSAG